MATHAVPSDATLVRYLLGTLPREDEERFDELSIVEPGFAERLRAIEHDLADATRGANCLNPIVSGMSSDFWRRHMDATMCGWRSARRPRRPRAWPATVSHVDVGTGGRRYSGGGHRHGLPGRSASRDGSRARRRDRCARSNPASNRRLRRSRSAAGRATVRGIDACAIVANPRRAAETRRSAERRSAADAAARAECVFALRRLDRRRHVPSGRVAGGRGRCASHAGWQGPEHSRPCGGIANRALSVVVRAGPQRTSSRRILFNRATVAAPSAPALREMS